MIDLLIAAAVAAAQPQGAACPDLVTPDALVCHAMQAQKSGDSAAAAQAFERAAEAKRAATSVAADPEVARLFAAAGNLWIEAGQPGKAAFALDRALQAPGLEGALRGEVLLDRARAAEAQNDLKTARATVTKAVELIEGDPFLWYFSAGLAVREGDYKGAEAAINRALRLAPTDPTVLFEAGHIAQLSDDYVGARDYWNRAIASAPNSASGRAAREALNMMPAPLTVKN